MNTTKVLLVAPTTNLGYEPDEVNSVVNALHPRLLQGKRATITGLIDMLAEGWDTVWFATHGDETGIYLTDGIAVTSELTTLIRATGASLTVFNTCSSYEVARAIFREVRCDFICTVKPVPDRMAFVTGSVFAQKLAEGFTPYDAYELAKPGQNTTYEFFQAAEASNMSRLTDWPGKGQQGQQSQRIDEQLSTIRSDLRRIEAIVSGNQQWNVEGVVPRLSDVAKRVEHLQEDFKDMRRAQIFNQRLLIALSAICIILMMTVALLVLQGFA